MLKNLFTTLGLSAGLSVVLLQARLDTVDADDPPAQHHFAQERPWDIRHIRLVLDVQLEARRVDGSAVLELSALRSGHVIRLDARQMEVHDVRLRGADGSDTAADYQYDGRHITVTLPEPMPRGRDTQLTVQYTVQDTERGLHWFGPTANEPDVARVVWSQGESVFNSYWFPCFDHPNEMQTTELIVTADAAYKVSSNGRLLGKRAADSGRTTWHYLQDKPHVAYLVSLIVGEFHVVTDNWKDLPLEYWVHPRYADRVERSFVNTKRMLEFFSEKIGVDYPWDRYAQLSCQGFGGGMENTSVTTLGLRMLHDERSSLDGISDGLIAHELAHQWFGDLLTCRDWAHLWLNEGFATYFEALWAEHDKGADAFAYNMYRKARSARRGGRERPIVDRHYEHPRNMFDSRAYPKGAWVLHMMRRHLGDAVFWRVVNRYTSDHAHETVETFDLRQTAEQLTGRSLERFFYDWTERPGHPKVDVAYDWKPEEKLARLTIKQSQDAAPFHFPLQIELLDADGTVQLSHTHQAHTREDVLYFPLPAPPAMVRIDPQQAVLMELSEGKGRALWVAQLQKDANPVARIRAAKHFADSKREADRAVLAEALAQDSFWGVRSEIASILGDAGGEVARDALIAGLRSEAPQVRRACASALGKFRKDEQAMAALKPVVVEGDPSYRVEAAAIAAYFDIEAPDARDLLPDLLTRESRNEVIRNAALQKAATLPDPDMIDLLIAWSKPDRPRECRPTALNGLSTASRARHLNDETYARIVGALTAALDDSGRSVRRSAARALGRLQDPAQGLSATRTLEHVAAHDADRRTQQAAEAALEAIRSGKPAQLKLAELQEEFKTLMELNEELQSRLDKLEQLQDRGDKPADSSAAAPAVREPAGTGS